MIFRTRGRILDNFFIFNLQTKFTQGLDFQFIRKIFHTRGRILCILLIFNL